MIPLTFRYDDYIDRPKLSEKKTHLSIYFLPPTSGSEQKHKDLTSFQRMIPTFAHSSSRVINYFFL